MDSPLELRFPHDVRHLAGPGLVVGRIGPLGDGDGKDACIALRVGGNDAEVGGAVEGREDAGGDEGEACIRVRNLGVVEEDAVKMEASFLDDLGADSLDIVELIMALEEEFDIEIPDEEAEKITTVGDAVNYISANS